MDSSTALFIKMDNQSFDRLSSYVTQEYGIKLPEAKRSMLESRLNKKVKSLGMTTYKEFIDHIFSEEGKQTDLFDVIDLITTNKTDFFREPAHFSYLSGEFLPHYTQQFGNKNLKIWSAGCSTGEEPYTLTMVLEEFKKRSPDVTYQVLATDISLRVMQAAYNGMYTMDRLVAVPLEMKRKYFLRSKADPNLAKVKPDYRKKIQYKRLNLMDDSYSLLKSHYDIIFCRNVMIYFDKLTQEKVIRKFCSHLKPGGLLFIGHSESIIGMNVPLKQVRPTIYQVIT